MSDQIQRGCHKQYDDDDYSVPRPQGPTVNPAFAIGVGVFCTGLTVAGAVTATPVLALVALATAFGLLYKKE